jgi:hypothetical protein
LASKTLARTVVVAALVAAVAVLTIQPVAGHQRKGTHEGDPVFTVESRNQSPSGVVHYVVRVTWSVDGHPVTFTNITATPIDPLGSSLSPVTLQPMDLDGRYAGTVTLPRDGTWTVRFTSTTPPGTAEVNEQVVLTVPGPAPAPAPIFPTFPW